jgi:uncharacterized protein YqeY
MSLREDLSTAMKDAMKAKDTRRLSTVRLVLAAIKDKDIASRSPTNDHITDDDILQLLTKMVKQREESAKIYAENARPELEAQEREEITIISSFLPKQLSDDEIKAIVAGVIAEIGAASIKDMGRTIAVLKERYAGQMDFAKASGIVKAALG